MLALILVSLRRRTNRDSTSAKITLSSLSAVSNEAGLLVRGKHEHKRNIECEMLDTSREYIALCQCSPQGRTPWPCAKDGFNMF